MVSPALLQGLYAFGSLRNEAEGVELSLKNRLADLVLRRLLHVRIGALELGAEDLELRCGEPGWRQALEVTRDRPLPFALKQVAQLRAPGRRIEAGPHLIEIAVEVEVEVAGFGAISLQVEDRAAISTTQLFMALNFADSPYYFALVMGDGENAARHLAAIAIPGPGADPAGFRRDAVNIANRWKRASRFGWC